MKIDDGTDWGWNAKGAYVFRIAQGPQTKHIQENLRQTRSQCFASGWIPQAKIWASWSNTHVENDSLNLLMGSTPRDTIRPPETNIAPDKGPF